MADRDTTSTPYRLSGDGVCYFRSAFSDYRPNYTALKHEIKLPNYGPVGRPLPLWGTWASDGVKSYSVQVNFLQNGEYLLPYIKMYPWNAKHLADPSEHQGLIRYCRDIGLPLTLSTDNILGEFVQNTELHTNDPATDPRTLLVNDSWLDIWDSNMPDLSVARQVGERFISNDLMFADLVADFPAPSKNQIILLSNNEAVQHHWYFTIKDENGDLGRGYKRFVAKHGTAYDRDDVEDGEQLCRLLTGELDTVISTVLNGMRSQMPPAYQSATRLIGYGYDILPDYGRWPGWNQYNYLSPELWTPGLKASVGGLWEGRSTSYGYQNSGQFDYQVWSTNTCTNNAGALYADKDANYPDIWEEMGCWYGNQIKIDQYASAGETFTPERYFGNIRYQMWITVARVVRDYFDAHVDIGTIEQWSVKHLVRQVHESEVLTRFWRKGVLVKNTTVPHPFRSLLRSYVPDEDRWHNLPASTDPQDWSDLYARVPFWSIARVLGTAPDREWLIITHAPSGDVSGVTVTIPGYQDVVLNGSVGGEYWHLVEGQAPELLVI